MPTAAGPLRGQVDWAWEDDVHTGVPNGLRPANGLLNARLNLHVDSAGLDVAVFGRNLTDRRMSVNQIDVVASLGFVGNGPDNAPCTFGLELAKGSEDNLP